jgi:hypothetical protein
MQISDLTVEVRDSSLARVGQILTADLIGFEAALRFNKVGSWKITLRSDHPLVDTLRSPGGGIIITGPTGVLLSGPTISATNVKTADDPTGTWDIVGVDDGVILGERLAYPVPSSASLAAQTTAYDVRTGKSESVAKAYVNANIGPSAPAARKISTLTIDTDAARGSTVVANARFDKLGELVSSLLVLDGLGFDIRQVGAGLVFEVFQPVDRSATIRMDVDNLRLEKSEYGYQRPDVTRVIVAGRGQGGERTFIERTSTASTTAESAWGRRIEVFKDARSTNDATALQNAGDELLSAGGKTIEGIKVTPSDDQTMRFGIDWGLGDKVTVVVGATQIAQIVTEVGIVITDAGVKIGATLGEPGVLEDYEAGLLTASTDQSARITALEVNESTGGINASSITTGTMDINRLPTIPLLTNTSDNLTVARGGTGATTFMSGAYLKGAGTSAITTQTGIPATDITSAILDASRLPAGLVLQAATSVLTTTPSTTSSAFVASGLSVTLTPRSSNSKFLLFTSLNTGNTGSAWNYFAFARGTTKIGLGVSGTVNTGGQFFVTDNGRMDTVTMHYFDSPATSSDVTYNLYFATYANTAYLNRRGADSTFRGSSSLTVLEVAG